MIQLSFLIEKMANAKLNNKMHMKEKVITYKWFN